MDPFDDFRNRLALDARGGSVLLLGGQNITLKACWFQSDPDRTVNTTCTWGFSGIPYPSSMPSRAPVEPRSLAGRSTSAHEAIPWNLKQPTFRPRSCSMARRKTPTGAHSLLVAAVGSIIRELDSEDPLYDHYRDFIARGSHFCIEARPREESATTNDRSA